ncbi:DNA modification methylase, partial [Paeniclostridium sordellii]|nr:DNA modification methylase [Paeniclostridium sordellii]
INTMFLKCRKKEKSIHDVKSMSIFGVSNLLSEDYIITMINSTLISHYVDNFVNNTQTFQINDARQLPIIIPTSTDDEQAKSFVSNAIKIKKGHTTNNALDVIQKEVDSYVEKIYNL